MGYSAFQRTAFQTNAYQIAQPERPAGGYPIKFDSEAYLEVYNNADRLMRRVKKLPPSVKHVIQELVEIDEPLVRKEKLYEKLKVETKFLRLYEAILEEYYVALLDYELMIRLHHAEMLQDEEDIALLLLMT